LFNDGALLEVITESNPVVSGGKSWGSTSVVSTGSDSSVAAGGVAALLEFSSADGTIAADLVSGIEANTMASLGFGGSLATWEVGVGIAHCGLTWWW